MEDAAAAAVAVAAEGAPKGSDDIDVGDNDELFIIETPLEDELIVVDRKRGREEFEVEVEVEVEVEGGTTSSSRNKAIKI